MLTGYLPSLGGLALAQSSGTGAGGATAAVIAAAAVLLAAFAFWRTRALGHELAASRKEREEAQKALEASKGRERELAKKAEERSDELRELKQDVAGVRKKNHAAQEELKALRDQLKTQAEERDRLLAARAAFEAPRPEPKPRPKPATRPEPSQAAPRIETPRAEHVEAPAALPAPEAAQAPVAEEHPAEPPAQAAPAVDPAVVTELTARVTKLEADHREASAALAAERETVKNQRNELARLRKYAEQLRRIDMVSKGKVEVLEDKLASLGRQYYETVSELAAVKGEVRPPSRSHDGRGPKPRRPREERGGHAKRDPSTEPEAHATPDSDSLAAQMEAADAEAELHHEDETAEAGTGRSPTGT